MLTITHLISGANSPSISSGLMQPEIGLTTVGIIFVAGFVMGLVGFGFNLVSIPLVSLVLGVRPAIGIGITATLVIGVLITRGDARHARWDRVRAIVPFSIIGLSTGALISARVPESGLRYTVAALTVAFAVYLFIKPKPRIREPNRAASGIAGFSSGLLGALTGMGGPPLAAYMTHTLEDPKEIRVSMTGLTLFTLPVNITSLLLVGAISVEAVVAGLLMSIPAFLGTQMGTHLFRQMPTIYPRAVAVTLTITVIAGIALGIAG